MGESAEHSQHVPTDKLLRAILDGVPAMVGYWDRQLRNRVANLAYSGFFGLSPKQMAGMHIRDLLGPGLFEKNLTHIDQALAGNAQLFDRAIVDASGQTRYTQASYVPDVVDDEVLGFFVLVTDITPRVEAEQKLQQSADEYRALVRSIPAGFVLLFDVDLRFRVADGQALERFGYSRSGLEGRSLWEALPAPVAKELEPRYRRALAGQETSWEHAVDDRHYLLVAGPVRGAQGEIVAGTVVCTDTTAERRAERFSAALRGIATLVASNGTVLEVARLVAGQLHELYSFEQAAVVEFDGVAGQIVAIEPPLPEVGTFVELGPDRTTATALVARTGRPAIVEYAPRPDDASGRLYTSGMRCGAAAPIAGWGAVALGSRQPGRFDQATLDELASFAELVALAIGNATAWAELRRQASTDTLSGLPNRRSFDEHLTREIANTERHHGTLTVVLMDIDRFKAVNDRHGHGIGDQVIAEVARRLSATARAGDVLARFGGEEFAWLLPDTTAAAAQAIAERARRLVSDSPAAEAGTVTVSAGIAQHQDGESSHGFLERADRALYVAKTSGRDRVVLAAAELARP
jgi:diguanylate cyclase (GGDEF)-like protein/PAS domain S-box-containing protein